MDKQRFPATYRLTERELSGANITWDELTRIGEDYSKLLNHLSGLADEAAKKTIRIIKSPQQSFRPE